ncbi:PTS system sugar-specific permease component family protein [[Clostridium] bifermentans ATCC 638]|uniref:Ascorbate-specific PTS system EIIC component n=1 Tax=Paraclostridium bifermentans ATCC 638 = DSM 14991 TaxID=1233171 RepID=T4VM13_PARBF|nr:PTS ascorbate transporter subunit IIC [Paraclostridium bifermentans]EQK42150.1 PTS system sugar-specific permease component family protein [[Clostridium] bifermentans ATCC 638] [Paraclostridium bifermentans ATCC 638 = DSM 14991]RIZ58905.1 PTS ascorbate transporter subunit IIC [Paraclostridium bifermentans]UAG19013.1 PTS ascorbate transporter subunit IIC [Paraclostridium bifermentans]
MSGFLKVTIDFLSEPSVLVGFIVLVGLLLQKKPIEDIIKGTLKAMVGFVVIAASAGIIAGSLEPFGKMFEYGFNVSGVIPNNEAVVALAMDQFGTATALIMTFGMIVNILIARFTKFKYIFLTGHHTLFMACMIAVILISGGMSGAHLIFTGSLALGLLMVISPAICQPFMKKITKNDSVALGHFSSVGYAISASIGKAVGKNSKSTEEMKVPKSLSFLRDSAVSISITMLILYIVVALVAGPKFIESELSGGKNFIVFSMIQALTFAAGFILIQNGVRLVLNEIVPAFKGIASKLVPNSKPALDCPIVFPYAPNAVLIGFLSSFIGGIVSMLALAAAGLVIIIPGVVPHFFTGATAGVFGNSTGGRKGAVIGAFVNGVIISLLPVALLPVLGSLGVANSTFSDGDFGVAGIFLGKVQALVGGYGLTAVLLGILAILVILTVSSNKNKSSKIEN